jgi:hypothetical protein
LWQCFEANLKAKSSWVELMNDLRNRAGVGSEGKADAHKVLFTGLKAVFTPKKVRSLPRGASSVLESEEDDSCEHLGLKPALPPLLQDLGAGIEVTSSPLLVEGNALSNS